MDTPNRILSAAPAFIVIFIIVWSSYALVVTYIRYRKLQHIKGPFIAAISPLWLFYHSVRGQLYLAVAAGLKKYGSPLRVAPGIIAIDDPVIYRHMLAPRSPFTKGHWFKGMKFDQRVDNILSMADEKHHAEMRNKVIAGYTGREVPTLEADVDAKVVELLGFVRQHVVRNESFDMARAVAFFTLDVLTQIAFGDKLGFLEKNEDVYNYIESSTEFYPIMELGSNHPTILNFLNSRIMSGAQPKPTDKFGFGAIVGHTQKVVAERFGPDKKEKQDMLGSFVRHGLTQVQCESESLLQILAGSDSTATALRTTLLYVLTNPRVYSRLVEEIKGALKHGNITRPVIKHTEAQNLLYLQAVIKEGLRVLMPLQGLGGRMPPKGGATINGVFIPEGTEVGVAIYAMQRREDIYGHDADTFRPERWVDDDPELINKMAKTHELIFASGRSSCLGKNIALMELSKAVFETLCMYDLNVVNAFKPMYMRSNGVVTQKEFFVRAYYRQQSSGQVHNATTQ